ncbi:MAG: hypothetical protein GWP91_11545, partial [Rhodobacterales bacterium]|nr:hypothetical protein [Rhodobacterales bacterium]
MNALCILLLLACGGPAADTDVPVTTPVDHPPTTLEEAMAGQGLEVQNGLFFISTLEGCCDPGANCYGNNVATPYGTPALPPSQGDVIDFVDVVEDWGALPNNDMSRTFRMRSDQAVLTVGNLPPPAKYFSYRSYLGEREDSPIVKIGSLGASLNNLVVAEQLGTEDIWGQRIAIITSGDAVTEARTRQALLALDWEADHIFTDRIAPGVVNFGLSPDSDRLFAVMRTAVYDDPAEGAAWLDETGWEVYRLTPIEELAQHTPHPAATLPSRGSGTTEADWIEAT